MARRKTPLTTWLLLSLAVLLLHLALLQTLPLNLGGVAADAPALTFDTRTLTPSPAPEPAAPTPRAKPAPKPATRVADKPPAPPAAVAPELPQPQTTTPPEPMADAPASAPLPPEPALAASAPPAPEPDPPPAPRPPRSKPPSFNADAVPASIKLAYKVEANKFPYTLNGELLWTQEGGHYLTSLSFGAFGQSRVQTSRGLIGPEGLAPERFSDKFRSEVAAHFNREQGKVTFSANTPDAPLLGGAQDRLSILIQLAALVASAPERFELGTTLTIQTVGPRDADLWLFTVGHTETLELPGGTLPALKLTRNPRQAYDQQVDLWLAPALGYLPARIRIQETNGDYIDQKWASSTTASMP